MSTMDQRTVLLVSDDAEFVRRLSDCWQGERVLPAFATAADREALHSNFDIAIVGPTTNIAAPGDRETPRSTLRELDKTFRPILALAHNHEMLQLLRHEFPRVVAIAIHETWPETLVSLAVETLRRIEAVKRAERAEQLNLVLRRNATLGQYVIDMRHSLNNALTSVLGNAELLLLEPGAFSAEVRSQLDTIRHMSLRMHEVLQRFSSLEKELSFAERQVRNEGGSRQAAAAAHPGL